MKKQQFNKLDYTITTDLEFQNKRFGISPELAEQLETLGYESQDKHNKKIIDKLTKLIDKHPTVPLLKNYLSVAYNLRGNHEKSIELNDRILAEHPDYLFGKLNKANEYIENSQFEEVHEILGEALEIKQLYPDRDVFHLGEITNFYKVVIRYYAAIENLELAENRLKILKKIAPDHYDTEDAEAYLFSLRMKKIKDQWTEERKQAIIPQIKKIPQPLEKQVTPAFNHVEISLLYKYGLDIPHEKLQKIIELPPKTLASDLEKMLQDAVDRFDYFKRIGWEEKSHSFILHALFLLKEINAVESLPKIINFLEYDYDFLDFWLGDHKTDTLWHCFYSLGFENTPLLKHFLLQQGVNTYSKTAASEALCQIALHCPERRLEVLAVYLEVLTHISQATLDDNIIDSDFLGLAIGDVIDCNLPELLPVIKVLYEKGYVALGINGDYNYVKKEFARKSKRDHSKKLYNIFELYDYVLSNWTGYNEDYEDNTFTPLLAKQAVSEKVGRNDPCPCGSGKKYKKCCMKE